MSGLETKLAQSQSTRARARTGLGAGYMEEIPHTTRPCSLVAKSAARMEIYTPVIEHISHLLPFNFPGEREWVGSPENGPNLFLRDDGMVSVELSPSMLKDLPAAYATCMAQMGHPLPIQLDCAMRNFFFTEWSWNITNNCAETPTVCKDEYVAARRQLRAATGDDARYLMAEVIAPMSLQRDSSETVFDDCSVRAPTVEIDYARLLRLKSIAINREDQILFIAAQCDIDDVLAELLAVFGRTLAEHVVSCCPDGSDHEAARPYTAYEHYRRLVALFRLWRQANPPTEHEKTKPLLVRAASWSPPPGEFSGKQTRAALEEAKKTGPAVY